MPFPAFYDPSRVGQLYTPDTPAAVRDGRAAGLNPASQAQVRTILLLVDVQVDFVHTDGALSVPGAIDDTRRTIEWIFNNVNRITTIAASLDSHVPIQIFFPTWWVDENDTHPAPYTVIRGVDVAAGKWRPQYDVAWSVEYVEQLEELSKKELMIWPYHTLIGTPGHGLTPALYEAIAFHAAARQTQPIFLSKGTIAKTEYYSMLEPEVKVPDHPLGTLNTDFLDMLAGYDKIYVAGQAKSHCVLETVTSMMRYFDDQPKVINKVRILSDCMSSVAHPTINFDLMANRQFAAFAARGLQLVDSSMPIR
jgi:nicotinamidase-related amidase